MNKKVLKCPKLCKDCGRCVCTDSQIFFESTIEVPRIKVGKKQTIETLINEEALLFAEYLRDEKKTWIPRIGILD